MTRVKRWWRGSKRPPTGSPEQREPIRPKSGPLAGTKLAPEGNARARLLVPDAQHDEADEEKE